MHIGLPCAEVNVSACWEGGQPKYATGKTFTSAAGKNLEAKANAAAIDGNVAFGGSERSRRANHNLRRQKGVVVDVVILEAGLRVPVAEPLRNEAIECKHAL